MATALAVVGIGVGAKSVCLTCGFPRAVALVVRVGANATRVFVIGGHRPPRARLVAKEPLYRRGDVPRLTCGCG